MKQVTVLTQERILWKKAFLAQYPWERMKGLLGKDAISREELLILPYTSSIHMLFMRFPIDLVFLNRAKQIIKIVKGLKPGKLSGCSGAFYALEMKAARSEELQLSPGLSLWWDENGQVALEFVLIIALLILGLVAAIPPLIRAFQQYVSRLLFYMADI